MFHLYITLAYIIPNIYVLFRIKKLFISKKDSRRYVVIYLLIASIYPVFERFSDGNTSLFIQIMASASGYLLAFFLYLFLSVFLFDIFLLFNLVFRIISVEKRKSLSFRRITLSTMVILSVLIVIAGVVNLNTIRLSEFSITVPRKKSKIDHLRVVFVADFHIQQSTRLGFVEDFVNKVKALQPDIMLYGGDIVEGDSENETSEAVESTLKSIPSKYGSFGVPGNHEYYGGQQQGTFFRRAGITLLCDTVVMIDSSFYLAGRVDKHFKKRKDLKDILKYTTSDYPSIIMDHRPNNLQDVSKTSVDVQFSGHTHNGQMFPINFITSSIYELSWGYEKITNTHFFVSSGLHLWGPPVKTVGKSEIMVVDIKFE